MEHTVVFWNRSSPLRQFPERAESFDARRFVVIQSYRMLLVRVLSRLVTRHVEHQWLKLSS